jgi:hypothetical protein
MIGSATNDEQNDPSTPRQPPNIPHEPTPDVPGEPTPDTPYPETIDVPPPDIADVPPLRIDFAAVQEVRSCATPACCAP